MEPHLQDLDGVWRGGSAEGDKWKIEIEVDRFASEDPFVCSIWG